jgi:hypothetical protein
MFVVQHYDMSYTSWIENAKASQYSEDGRHVTAGMLAMAWPASM